MSWDCLENPHKGCEEARSESTECEICLCNSGCEEIIEPRPVVLQMLVQFNIQKSYTCIGADFRLNQDNTSVKVQNWGQKGLLRAVVIGDYHLFLYILT